MKTFKLICVLSLVFLIGILFAGEGHKIMLLNSDASVEKYRVAQDEFRSTIVNPVVEIDLGEKKWKPGEVEDLLYDEYPDLVYCIGTEAYLLASKYVRERNIVFSSILNWRRLSLTDKTCGVSSELNPEMQITLYRAMFPQIRRIGVLYSGKYNKHWFQTAQEAGKEMGVEIIGRALSKARDTIPELQDLLPHIDALWLISDPLVISDKVALKDIFTQCNARKKPVLSYHDAFSEYGAVLIVSVDNPTMGRQAAAISKEVLSGDPVKTRVQLPAGSHIILNEKKAIEYGLMVGDTALGMVNEVIE